MALFKVTVTKRLDALDNPTWTNVYNFDTLGVNTALDAGVAAGTLEMSCSPEAVHVTRITAKPVAGGQVGIRSVDIGGELVIDPANLIPYFNTVRVILTDSVERSESKYLRSMIAEANVQGFQISGELKDFINDNYAQPLLGLLGLRGPNGELIVAATVQQKIQMRQNGWHRRTRPGYKRGWVPV